MTDSSQFFSELLDFNNMNRLEPKPGRILISEPFMPDGHFSRSIVLLGEHNQEGTFGFVLNHYVEVKLPEIIANFPQFNAKLAKGGPVKTNNLYYIHTMGEKIPGSLLVKKGLYMGGSFEAVTEMIAEKKITAAQIRFFLGYAGWSDGQLKGELAQNAWMVSTASVKDIMNTSITNLWELALKKLGGKYKVISNFPADPGLN